MIILGSASKARKHLLESIDFSPGAILVPDINETLENGEKPINYVKRMASQKSRSLNSDPENLLLTADTIVVIGTRILPKTSKREVARHYLTMLSGKRHKVYTAMCLKHKNLEKVYVEKTIIKMRNLSESEIEKYLDTDQWVEKAGGYGIQGSAISFFPFISGCVSNVIGLPLPKLVDVLKGMDIEDSD